MVNSLWVIPLHVEREYYLACACEELYCPPTAYFSLYGLTVQASFLGGSKPKSKPKKEKTDDAEVEVDDDDSLNYND
ncbi:hypothetical protein LOK49_LG07G01707 [Camellia lanceoleosa]|uniref:Uncharacterized protein n=1 Tax=Camellia lanceoleosa TaxID=1840588 RepID=A0ACC0H6F6_9ERIC|nr:hypothetical protein LOK49_LG07G01707 [Camellia lanceoleosa]